MKNLLSLLVIVLIVGLAGSCKKHKTHIYDNDDSYKTNVSKPEMSQASAIEENSIVIDEEEYAKEAEVIDVDDSELTKIANDVDEYCEGIQSFIDNEIPCTSSSAYRFQNSPIASRIEKYKEQGRLTPQQVDQIEYYEQEWINMY